MLKVQALGARMGSGFRLRAVSCSVGEGELLAVLGPNGSGKSTLLRLLLGLQAPSEGTISWSGQVLSEAGQVRVPPESRGMGVLFQEGVLFPHLSVRDNVALAVKGSGAEADALVRASLRAMHIEEHAARPVTGLSGGEQQRVALARAWAQRPRVLLLDEPFHSLDATVKRPIIAELRATVKQQNVAAVFVTHDIEEASSLSDSVVLLRDGAVVQQGTMEQLYRFPVDRWTAAFLGELQSIDAEQARGWGVELPAAEHGQRVWFRPEELVLEPGQPGAPVLVELRRPGARVQAVVRFADGSTAVSHAPAAHGLRAGQPVRARIVAALPDALNHEAAQ